MPRQAYNIACPDISLVVDDAVKAVSTTATAAAAAAAAMDTDVELGKGGEGCETIPGCSGYSSMVHSKKVIKHALRQQAKRRRKNTTIAAGNSRTLPRIVVKPLPPPPPNDPPSPVNNVQHVNTAAEEPAATMREVLASLPGFSLKSSRRRSTKRLSATAQLEAGLVDLESPASILASTSLRALLNRHTFQGLPPLYQRKLAQLLPAVDRQDAAISGLNNEFFARACLEWRKRLAEGEFTPENQQRLKMEAERDKNKLDPWKVKHFEPIWGEKREPKLKSNLHYITESRSSGAVTRSSLRLRLESNVDIPTSEHAVSPIVMTEDKVDTSCKTEISIKSSDDLVNSEEVQQNLMPLDYNPLSDNVTDEKHDLDDSMQMNSMEVMEDIQMHESKIEEVDKITDICEKQDMIEASDIARQICEEAISNVYEEETDFPSSEKNLQPMENNMIEASEEDTVLLPDDNSSPRSSEQIERASHTSGESISQLSSEYISQTSIDQISQISKEQISQISSDQIYQISDCETTSILESSSPQDQVRPADIVIEDTSLLNSDQTEMTQTSHENPADSESQIPEGMEIDSETLQRIHELEVRGEMREMYEEISGCPEEIIYPILEGMEMASTNAEVTEPQVVSGQTEDTTDVNAGNEEEALREANNYVCSEMLECSWTVDPTVNNISNNTRTQEELQVPWPLVAAALDGSVAANITVTTQDECSETSTTTDSTTSSQQFINADTNVESVNCIQLPVVQGTTFQSDGLAISTPGSSCVMKSLQSQSPPIIAFPQLQSIRFVQASFNPEQETTSSLANNTSTISAQLQPQQTNTAQVNMIRAQDTITQINTQNNSTHNNVNQNTIATQGQVQNTLPATMGVQSQNRGQNAIVIQHQTTTSAQPRQIVAASVHQPQQQQQQQQQQQTQQQQQQYAGSSVTVSSRSSRVSNQGSQRGSRNNNKEQGSGRSRSSTKEPPGAVNLERSYQICQAVIQSSPNRDQLKAHLKPPPSLLARGDGAFTTNKSGGRTLTTVKPQKTQQTIQHNKQAQNKTQAVMLRHVFATARQATSTEC
ncbi:polycomb protein Asx isoform X2 [Monomorium pharaonis]|uniref:polycomb protein Asx isoform X2 n=1 Tax=Monomorium pharaonis TaxID=307658 RepID=UPI0017466B63|nr:polycomb protein Asx isoform X2 [Monomorium pharaonis]